MDYRKLISLIILVAVVSGIYFGFSLDQYLHADYLQANYDSIYNQYERNPVAFGFIFINIYVLITMFSIPAATPLTLFAGSIFGFYKGVFVVSIASSIGATCAFLLTRFYFKEFVDQYVNRKYPDMFSKINSGVDRHGFKYLFFLRLIPVFPFFIINSVMGLTKMKAVPFFIVSFLGMLLGTIVYVNAGVKLLSITEVSDLWNIEYLGAFIALGIFLLIGDRLKRKYN